jgi:hypothetical protein
MLSGKTDSIEDYIVQEKDKSFKYGFIVGMGLGLIIATNLWLFR